VDKEMANAPMRRIQKLIVKINAPHLLSDEHKQRLEDAAHRCPVHKSMHPDREMPIEFGWG
jgi:putative redox protein